MLWEKILIMEIIHAKGKKKKTWSVLQNTLMKCFWLNTLEGSLLHKLKLHQLKDSVGMLAADDFLLAMAPGMQK